MKFKERVDFIKKKKEVGELTSQHLIAQNEPEQKKNEGTEGLVNQRVLSWDPRDKG